MDVEPEGEDGGIWRRGQDHFRHFTSLLEDELEEETSMIQSVGHRGRIIDCKHQDSLSWD